MKDSDRYKAFQDDVMYDFALPTWNGGIQVWKDNKPQTEIIILEPLAENMPMLLKCTGIRDESEELIYEGDIVTYIDMYSQKKTRVIRWNDKLAKFDAYFDSNYTKMDTLFRITGSIYDSKELRDYFSEKES